MTQPRSIDLPVEERFLPIYEQGSEGVPSYRELVPREEVERTANVTLDEWHRLRKLPLFGYKLYEVGVLSLSYGYDTVTVTDVGMGANICEMIRTLDTYPDGDFRGPNHAFEEYFKYRNALVVREIVSQRETAEQVLQRLRNHYDYAWDLDSQFKETHGRSSDHVRHPVVIIHLRETVEKIQCAPRRWWNPLEWWKQMQTPVAIIGFTETRTRLEAT